MADKPRKKKRNLKDAEAVEVHEDAWERFESTVRRIVPGKPKDERKNTNG
jgi:hypothetical protein